MHVAFIVSQFPSLSHTFIDSQILGLQSAGHRVSVHAFTPPVTPLVHAYWLTPNHPLEIHQGQRSPQGFWSRLRLAFRLAPQFRQAKSLWLLGLLAPPFHPFARRLEPLVWAAPLLGALDADVWVCHFGDVALRAQAVMHLARQRVPLLAFFHGADISRFVQRHGEGVYRQLLEEIEGCCAISVRWLNRLLDLGARPDRVHLHHMGWIACTFQFRPELFRPRDRSDCSAWLVWWKRKVWNTAFEPSLYCHPRYETGLTIGLWAAAH